MGVSARIFPTANLFLCDTCADGHASFHADAGFQLDADSHPNLYRHPNTKRLGLSHGHHCFPHADALSDANAYPVSHRHSDAHPAPHRHADANADADFNAIDHHVG
jgi:hypothetical protein